MKKISLKNLSHKKKKHKIKNLFLYKKLILFFSKVANLSKLPFKSISKLIKKSKKPKKIISNFLGEIHHKIERNNFLSNSYLRRIIIILFFLGINIQLLPFFLATNRIKLPDEILVALDNRGIINKEDYIFEHVPQGIKYEEPSLVEQEILKQLNAERKIRDQDELIYSDRLASAAAELLLEFETYDFELEDKVFSQEFKLVLNNVNYNYEHVSQNMVVGPLKEAAVIDAWLSNEQQLIALFADDFEEIGLATKVIKTKYNETLGVTVQILGKEFKTKPQTKVKQSTPQIEPQAQKTFTFPPITNKEVFDALNSYRDSHTVHKLTQDEDLCKYAEKRVQDLVKLGSLDNHEGFKKDFENYETLPQSIKDYKGENIAENLAFQNCKNMTTGDGFIAESGASIIEWCFDSSTAGHREAQLSRELNHACVRNQNGFFVVIFGKK
jgi:uncharacterized protein YkwD